jgi:hypothetical protein
MAWM